MKDSKSYKDKKAFFKNIITMYGRNVVLELLKDESIKIHKVHLSDSNKIDENIKNIISIANKRQIEIENHSKNSLSRISKNAKQDQGVAMDILSKNYLNAKEIENLNSYKLIALDGIHNPQNLGMIIRSCAAGNVDGILLPKKNTVKISPLVMKASAGNLFKIPLYFCDELVDVLEDIEADVYMLSSSAKNSLYDIKISKKTIFILGNESDGVSKQIQKLCKKELFIPMNRGVESLNVAVSTSLIAFMKF